MRRWKLVWGEWHKGAHLTDPTLWPSSSKKFWTFAGLLRYKAAWIDYWPTIKGRPELWTKHFVFGWVRVK